MLRLEDERAVHLRARAMLAVLGILVTLFAGSALIERRRWAWPLEVGRVVLAGSVGMLVVSRVI